MSDDSTADGGGNVCNANCNDDGGPGSYWHQVMEWIEGNGGYVNPNLRHDRIPQIVHLGDDDNDDNDDDDDDNDDYVGGEQGRRPRPSSPRCSTR